MTNTDMNWSDLLALFLESGRFELLLAFGLAAVAIVALVCVLVIREVRIRHK